MEWFMLGLPLGILIGYEAREWLPTARDYRLREQERLHGEYARMQQQFVMDAQI